MAAWTATYSLEQRTNFLPVWTQVFCFCVWTEQLNTFCLWTKWKGTKCIPLEKGISKQKVPLRGHKSQQCCSQQCLLYIVDNTQRSAATAPHKTCNQRCFSHTGQRLVPQTLEKQDEKNLRLTKSHCFVLYIKFFYFVITQNCNKKVCISTYDWL